ncbi:galactosyltransferase-domain-containing protein [Tribonema minus]|uniref:Hexosyltransferase n=1 Tax=Tribonema minus TaxID=303371 RepID=A0A835YNB7_9STRA|nr:galactosyltransferase-domain-containing protein [Tribonema minus]
MQVLFLVSHIDASEEGDLVGDILYVQCPAGYRNIVQKTKAMLSIVTHFNHKYLMKSDDDTFVCLNRVAKRMFTLPPAVKEKVYAGIPTACGLESNPHIGRVIKDPNHKWHDAKFVSHTLGGLDCYPAYHQGAFYLLSEPLVQYLHQGRSKLLTFTNEDVTMGSWLMGVDREMIAFNSISEARLWECTCAKYTKWLKYDTNAFFHNCKSLDQLQKCAEFLPFC